jgi:hypothetical protein
MAELEIPENAFTRSAGSDGKLPDDSPSVIQAAEYRRIQLSTEPVSPEELAAAGGPHPDTQTVSESQASESSANEIIHTEDTNALPKGASGRILSKGTFEVKSTTASKPFSAPAEPVKAPKWGVNPAEHPEL